MKNRIFRQNYERQHQADFVNSNSTWTEYLLWNENWEMKEPGEVNKLAKGVLQKILYNETERVLKIRVPPKKLKPKLERLTEATFFDFSHRFRKPIAEVTYTGLIIKGERPANIVTRKESRELGKTLEEKGFEVVCYDARRNGTIILYASPHMAGIIHQAILCTEEGLKTIKKDLTEFSED